MEKFHWNQKNKDVFMKPIYSDILKELRKDKRLTQKDMGDMLNISQSTYCDYENGVRRMPLSMLCFLADTLETSTDYILGRTAQTRPYPKRPGRSAGKDSEE